MIINDMPLDTILFTHITDAGLSTTYSVTHMWRKVHELVRARTIAHDYVKVSASFAQWCIHNRGIEQHRLDRLKEEHLKEPILVIERKDMSMPLIVDGHHRYVKSAHMGIRTIPAYCVLPYIWESCIVEGLPELSPEELQDTYSGF